MAFTGRQKGGGGSPNSSKLTPAQQRERTREQDREALLNSEAIDRGIAREKAELERTRPMLKILLLGQSESGKSTTLKAFKLQYAPNQFRTEVGTWTAVVLLNLVRSVLFILEEILKWEHDYPAGASSPNPSNITLSSDIQDVRMRLRLLANCEAPIRTRIDPEPMIQVNGPSNSHNTRAMSPIATSPTFSVASSSTHHNNPINVVRKNSRSELMVRSSSQRGTQRGPTSPVSVTNAVEMDFRDARKVIASLANEMYKLWNDGAVRAILRKRDVDLQNQPGFFLDTVHRVADINYVASIEDVLKARLRTFGAQEHIIHVENGTDAGKRWLMIDVGGSKNQRQSWIPFFDHVHSIIFLAPVSAFDQQLVEDPHVNRLEDSVYIWRDICTNKLLVNVHMILFLNKTDVLERKLRQGIKFSDYVTNYEGENTVPAVLTYLTDKFHWLHHHHSPRPRQVGIFKTSVVDHRATPSVLAQVRSVIVHNMLKRTGMI